MPKPVLYISGPMSGHDNYNFPAFQHAAHWLRSRGHSVVNPADFGANERYSWRDCLIRDLNALGYCDIMIQLPGWEASRGAALEKTVAEAYGIKIYSWLEFLQYIRKDEDVYQAEGIVNDQEYRPVG